MEYFRSQFEQFSDRFSKPQNLEYVGDHHAPPHSVRVNPINVEHHKRTLEYAFNAYLYPWEIHQITQEYRRSDVTEEAILKDFFDNDIANHDIVLDVHFRNGLNAMLDAFRPPVKCKPAHIYDVQHHYPYKWQVNAEAPFSTDRYFLDNRPTFREVFERLDDLYAHLDTDWHRRYGSKVGNENFMDDKVPAKFGPMKETVFSWTHRWHHVIKSDYLDLAGLDQDYYFRTKYVFPMLLHTKTAIVKKDDPNKMRTIWGCSKPWIIDDTSLWWEFVAWIKFNPGCTPMLWGYETFTGGWMRLNAALFSSYMKTSFLTLDWKRFDKRAYFTIIREIMIGVSDYLDFNNGYLPTKDYPDTQSTWTEERSLRLRRLYVWSVLNLFTAPIVLPDGRMFIRNFAGIPSGLFITQLLDSWYNYLMIATILSALGFDPKQCLIKVQGDDSVVRLYILIPPDAHDSFLAKFAEEALRRFNSVVSDEKSEIRNSLNGVEVLSYRNKNGIPYRDEITMLAQFYHTKARNPSPSITMAQAIGFAYASCGHHDRVLSVLEDVYNHYAKQGYEPNRAGLSLVFGNSPDLVIPHYDLTHFPTRSEIQTYLTSTSHDDSEMRNRFWPSDHFLHAPCSRV